MTVKKISFNTPIISADRKFSVMEAFDDYFFLHGKKYRVIKPLGGNDFYVKSEKVETNIPLNIVKFISYCTGIIPLIMLIGQAIAKSQYNFFKKHDQANDRVSENQPIVRNFAAKIIPALKRDKTESNKTGSYENALCSPSQICEIITKNAYQDKTTRLAKAFMEEKPALAAWLIQKKGASLSELDAYTKTISMTKEKKELLNWLKIIAEPKEAFVENLDHFALTLGLGYKSANLIVMEQQAEQMSKKLKTATVKVPPFLPVGDFEMSQHIRKSIPHVFAKWEQFLKNTFDPCTKQAFLDADSNEKASKTGLKITKDGEAVLKEIQQEITEHFKSQSYHSPQMTAWLSKVNPQFLIIRSTGKEDSDTNSNAGGNASIPYVKPENVAISIAIGEVIASYFGEKSINQRILCGDRSLFTDDKPFVPILMQEMVGENLGGKGSKSEDIPRSGVLFTRQNDKAEGVTFIQAGLGNNEGIVSSQVSVDSYYVKQDKVHAVIRNKETRFVSHQGKNGKITVEPIKNNNTQLARSQALSNNIILDIKKVADDISETYAKEKGGVKPMDMEYTVKLKEKGSDKPVIYLLQARPLMNTKGESAVEHTYLDLGGLKKVPQEKKFSSEVLLDGNAYVRKITDPGSVIFADDLPKAADRYLHEGNQANKKVIILKKTAPATSHESVILRPKGVAVIVVSDPEQYAALKKLSSASSEDAPLLVDTQRGILVACSNKETPDLMIRKGLVSYPIPLEVSIPPSQIMQQFNKFESKDDRSAKDLIANFNKEADNLISKLQGEKELLLNVDTRELLDIMATKDEGEAKIALATLLRRLKNRLVMSMKETEDFRKNINLPMFQIFEHAIASCKKEIIPALEQYPAQSLERLYPIKFLDAMIHQKMNPDAVGASSYYQVLALDLIQKNTMESANKLGIKYDVPGGQKLIFLHGLSGKAYNQKCGANWLSLVGELAKMEAKLREKFISRLLPIVLQTADLSVTDKWLNISFNNAWKKHKGKSSAERAEAVISELEKVCDTNKKTLDWIQDRIGTIATAKQGTSNWTDPVFAEKFAPKIKKTFTEVLGFDNTGTSQNSIKAVYEASDEFGKLALLQYISDAVNTYDCIIKAAKGSESFSSDQSKALLIAELLEGYFEMMEATFTLVPVSDQKVLMETGDFSPIVLFNSYINKLKNGFAYNFGSKKKLPTIGFKNLVENLKSNSLDASLQLEARPEFAVDSLIVGSKADLNFSVHWPNRLEEYFTTFHQNMEQIVKLLNTKNGLNANLLSETAKDLCNKTSAALEQEISYINLEEGKIHVGYQIPLRQHAASFVISYDPKHKEKGLDLKIHMFGNDENKRWDWAATFGAILAYQVAGGFAEDTPPQIDYSKPEGVTFTLKIPPDFKDGTKLIDTIRYITQVMTMDKDGSPSSLLKYMQQGENNIWDPSANYEGLGEIDWEKLNPDCFKYTLHINTTLMSKLQELGKEKTVAKVAINSIKGLAHYGIKNYTRSPGLSLSKRAVYELKALIPAMPEIQAEIQKLIDDPDVQKIPGVCSELKQALENMHS